MKFINNIEQFFLKAEQFFDNVVFIPRLLGAFKVGMNAFNDHLFAHTRGRQEIIKQRQAKPDVENRTTESNVSES